MENNMNIIAEEIDNAITDIIVKHQDELGITSGDDIGDLVLGQKYSQALYTIAEVVCKTLAYQCCTNGIKGKDAEELMSNYL